MTGPVPGSLEWTAQAAQGLVPDPFAELPAEHRPKSRPLSVVFRVDAVDSEDARKQLQEVVVTAQAIIAGLRPHPSTGLLQEVAPPIPGRPAPEVQGLGPVRLDPKHIPRPWDDDRRGMGE